jgi:hypothetical protein
MIQLRPGDFELFPERACLGGSLLSGVERWVFQPLADFLHPALAVGDACLRRFERFSGGTLRGLFSFS